jgi:3-dehydroquinate synthase
MKKTIKVRHRNFGSSYKYTVGRDILRNEISKAKNKYRKIVIVTDETIDSLYLNDFENDFEIAKVVIKPGEQSKSFQTLEYILNEFSRFGLKRNSLVVVVGGGVVGDVAGFAASVYMRGIDFWQVPTTLVAMVDSAIGGKTGINTEYGKNLAGAFYNPKKIISDLIFLDKLPEKEVKNGLAEMFKHCLIADKKLLDGLIENPKSLDSVLNSAKVKIKIVEKDVLEKKERKYLNVGHTIAHAIEKDSNFEIAHGQAVAIGIMLEAQISYGLGLVKKSDYEYILAGLNKLGLETDYTIRNFESFIEFMRADKKNAEAVPTFALVIVPGKKIAVLEVSIDNITKILNA